MAGEFEGISGLRRRLAASPYGDPRLADVDDELLDLAAEGAVPPSALARYREVLMGERPEPPQPEDFPVSRSQRLLGTALKAFAAPFVGAEEASGRVEAAQQRPYLEAVGEFQAGEAGRTKELGELAALANLERLQATESQRAEEQEAIARYRAGQLAGQTVEAGGQVLGMDPETQEFTRELGPVAPDEPSEVETFRTLFYPGWLQQQGIDPTQAKAQHEMQAFSEFMSQRRQPFMTMPLAPEAEEQRLRMLREETAIREEAKAGEATGLAQMVIEDPSLLDSLPPSGRMQVLSEIAKAGAGSQLAAQRNQSTNMLVDQALESVKTLKEHPGMAAAVGVRGPTGMFGGFPGTAAREYVAHFDTLKSRLTLPQLRFLRGLGHMSDREFMAIFNSVTALSRDMSEKAFMAELDKIEANLTKAKRSVARQTIAAPAGVNLQELSTEELFQLLQEQP